MCLAVTAKVCTNQFISHSLIIDAYRTLKESRLWNFNSRLLKVKIKQLSFKQRKRRECDVVYCAACEWEDRVSTFIRCMLPSGRKSTTCNTLPI